MHALLDALFEEELKKRVELLEKRCLVRDYQIGFRDGLKNALRLLQEIKEADNK